MPKVVSNLWFAEEAREAVEFYVSVIPDSRIGRTTILPAETPSGPPGSVELIEFTLAGQAFLAMKAGPLDSFNHSFSIAILVESQAEIDRIWEAFLANGGTPEACGWLKDRWGLSWQIVPRVLSEMVADSDRERARRVTEVMLGMVKIDVAALEDAFNG
ncbi:VOC family protein [Rhizobium laguerreae]|uniref:3-demethylubiquinone-9 3-methyltransferase (Glyoxalase superfamily) n=1 Tax=Rhizobium laguerreae TaxID=1076926 RepID=A0A1S9GTD8_9HYPH|nr:MULTISPECIES: VOC family protein [Rhizobium]MBB3160431.1 putative 3-demethylubiquinone-9 3-methyltransferase (glyoxalase superfamily) [Rhizobium laguerreae]MBY3035531.1 VOC family protein [Rhizobium laguerreae]MBY3063623.1 VOC family protein [Rhizobium laguerreae]MBY3078555.1 VOC family protein [Rhizobium laguerreae]MBY3084608.1 VOC family protein [Rhizobium laguerreae]